MRNFLQKTDYKSIDFRLVYGALIRVLILGIGLVIGLISAVSAGTMDISSLMTAAAYLVTILLSGSMARLQHKLEYRNYKEC